MKRIKLMVLGLLLGAYSVFAQEVTTGYVIGIEGQQIFIDLTAENVSPEMRLAVFSSGGYFEHPVTKERIAREEELVAMLKVEKVFDKYSIASAVPAQSLQKIAVGMKVTLLKSKTINASDSLNITTNQGIDKVAVIVAPAQVNDIVGIGYFGTYVADILMEQLMLCDKVRLLDRSVLGAQMDEIELTGEYIDPVTAIQQGKIAGAQYIIQVTMQKPDVVNITTGIPLASIMGAISAGARANIGAQYASNMNIERLKASVSLSVRVVDLQTGEVVFMSSATGKAQGKSQISMEYGALSGAQLNGGADGFKQTVTGQAIQKAFIPIGRNLNNYFNGKTTEKVLGSVSGYGNFGDELNRRGSRLYLGTVRQSMEDVQLLFSDQPQLFFQYRTAKRLNSTATWVMALGGLVCIGGPILGNNGGGFDGEVALGIGGGVAIIGGILYFSSCGKIKNIVNEYNKRRLSTSLSLGLVARKNSLGLCLTF